jgi:hypothetical protein
MVGKDRLKADCRSIKNHDLFIVRGRSKLQRSKDESECLRVQIVLVLQTRAPCAAVCASRSGMIQ